MTRVYDAPDYDESFWDTKNSQSFGGFCLKKMEQDLKKHKLIYLASPYTAKSKKLMHERFKEISKVGAKLVMKGHILFCPISQSVALAKYGNLKTNWAFWKTFDLTVLSKCDELWVVKMPGWKESVGVQAEIQYAEDNGIKIRYLRYETKEKSK